MPITTPSVHLQSANLRDPLNHLRPQIERQGPPRARRGEVGGSRYRDTGKDSGRILGRPCRCLTGCVRMCHPTFEAIPSGPAQSCLEFADATIPVGRLPIGTYGQMRCSQGPVIMTTHIPSAFSEIV